MASSIFADSGGNPFDQDLNTDDDVVFAGLTVTGEATFENDLQVLADLAINDSLRMTNGSVLRGATVDASSYSFNVYDVNGAAYRAYLTATAGDAPAVAIGIPTSGTLEVQASTYKSSDGSTGATGSANAANTLTIKNGLVTNIA